MIHELLRYGKENAIRGKALAEVLGLPDIRAITQIVERERRDGISICATTNSQNPGYFLPKSPEEMAAYIKSLNRRLRNVRRTMISCEDTLCRMTGQERLEGLE